MPFTRADFDNPEVLNALNPSTRYGYFHGPLKNNNPDWPILEEARTITPELNAQAPNPAEKLSGINGGVCPVAVNGQQQCGAVFRSQPAFRRHLRQTHPGAVINPDHRNTRDAETIAGQNALKQYVLGQHWRHDRFLHEPGAGPSGGWLEIYADACEALAAQDSDLAGKWGTRFHRGHDVQTPGSKRRQGPPPPESDSDDDESPSRPAPRTPKRHRTARIVHLSNQSTPARGGGAAASA